MPKRNDPENDKVIGKRVAVIIQLSGLEISGFAEYVGISESHVYAIVNGHRKLTMETARRIGKRFRLKPEHIFNLDYEVPASIRATPTLLEFMAKEKDVPEYFQETKDSRRASYYIEHKLLKSSLFKEDEPTYLWEAREFCLRENKYYSSDQLSKLLKYQVKKGRLRSGKRTIKRKDGTYGTRLVDVFFKTRE